MTHAAKSHDAFERLQELRDELERHAKEAEALQGRLERAQREADLALLLADVAGVLRDVDTRNLSEGKRVRLQGVRQRVLEAMRAA